MDYEILKPLKDYIKAIEANKQGNTEEALKLLTDSIGLKEPTKIMKENLAQMLDSNDAILTLILKEIEDGSH